MSEDESAGQVEMQNVSSAGKVLKRPLLDVTHDAEELPVETTTSPHFVGVEKSSTTRAALNTIKSIVGIGILRLRVCCVLFFFEKKQLSVRVHARGPHLWTH
jgi:hypothetical protein